MDQDRVIANQARPHEKMLALQVVPGIDDPVDVIVPLRRFVGPLGREFRIEARQQRASREPQHGRKHQRRGHRDQRQIPEQLSDKDPLLAETLEGLGQVAHNRMPGAAARKSLTAIDVQMAEASAWEIGTRRRRACRRRCRWGTRRSPGRPFASSVSGRAREQMRKPRHARQTRLHAGAHETEGPQPEAAQDIQSASQAAHHHAGPTNSGLTL